MRLDRFATTGAPAKEVRLFRLADELLTRFGRTHHQMRTLGLRVHLQASAISIASRLVYLAGYVAAIVFVVDRAVAGQATIGDAVLTAVLVLPSWTSPPQPWTRTPNTNSSNTGPARHAEYDNTPAPSPSSSPTASPPSGWPTSSSSSTTAESSKPAPTNNSPPPTAHTPNSSNSKHTRRRRQGRCQGGPLKTHYDRRAHHGAVVEPRGHSDLTGMKATFLQAAGVVLLA